MPIFDYKCKHCGLETELMVKDYLEVRRCPRCHKEPMERQVCAPSFRLYGDGFYKPNKR